MTDTDDALVSQLAPYRDRPGVKAALLVSRDGFLVAALADDDLDAEAVAAQIGGVIDIAGRLAGELGQEQTKYVAFELDRLNVVLAPFNEELMLALIGSPEAIALSFTLCGGRAWPPPPHHPAPAAAETVRAGTVSEPHGRSVVPMEDASEKLDQLARAEEQCTRCSDIVACRLRALSGAGHPHAQVMFVSLCPSPEDEADGLPAGASITRELSDLIPSLSNGGREKSYFTTVLKCVPRSERRLRRPRPDEQENCFGFLSSEISITTPHYIVPIGEETSRFLLGKLFRSAEAAAHDPLDLRVYDSPAFRVVPIAAPDEIATRDQKERHEYVKRLRSLASLMGL